jgi:hypothetical protein
VTERPIIFSGPMVRALLAGRKTQTRRIVKGVDECPHGYDGVVTATVPKEAHLVGKHCFALASGESLYLRCPYGVPGDRLWVRETFAHEPATYCWEASVSIPAVPASTSYRADWKGEQQPRWTPAIHMPRKLCRLRLEVTRVRVERLQGISEVDAKAEGVTLPTNGSHSGGYAILWDSLKVAKSPIQEGAAAWPAHRLEAHRPPHGRRLRHACTCRRARRGSESAS